MKVIREVFRTLLYDETWSSSNYFRKKKYSIAELLQGPKPAFGFSLVNMQPTYFISCVSVFKILQRQFTQKVKSTEISHSNKSLRDEPRASPGRRVAN